MVGGAGLDGTLRRNIGTEVYLHVAVLGHSHGHQGRKVQGLWSFPLEKSSRPMKASLGYAEEGNGEVGQQGPGWEERPKQQKPVRNCVSSILFRQAPLQEPCKWFIPSKELSVSSHSQCNYGCGWMEGAEVNIRRLPLSLPTFEMGSVIEPGSHRLSQTAWPASSGYLPVSLVSPLSNGVVTDVCVCAWTLHGFVDLNSGPYTESILLSGLFPQPRA